MKPLLSILAITFCVLSFANAQSVRQVHGTLIDSTKKAIPAANITLTSDQHDSITTVSDTGGKFAFPAVKGAKLAITFSAAGYPVTRKHFALTADTAAADLGAIILKAELSMPKIVSNKPKQVPGGRQVYGMLIDSTKQGVPAVNVTITSDQHDSTTTVSDLKGKFVFPSIKGSKVAVTISSIGYQAIRRHYTLTNDTADADLGTITVKAELNMLKGVTIVGVVPIRITEDTVEYKASAYKVRENAPVEDLIKKLPGVDVDANGNISTQGKQVTKVRINGKDFMGGDVQSATKNLPADVVENIQMIDDYGDQANLTGVKTGEPDKIMNITIRQDKTMAILDRQRPAMVKMRCRKARAYPTRTGIWAP